LSVFGAGDCQKRRASSAVSQFPSRTPASWHLSHAGYRRRVRDLARQHLRPRRRVVVLQQVVH
jgi:hypothetical protein